MDCFHATPKNINKVKIGKEPTNLRTTKKNWDWMLQGRLLPLNLFSMSKSPKHNEVRSRFTFDCTPIQSHEEWHQWHLQPKVSHTIIAFHPRSFIRILSFWANGLYIVVYPLQDKRNVTFFSKFNLYQMSTSPFFWYIIAFLKWLRIIFFIYSTSGNGNSWISYREQNMQADLLGLESASHHQWDIQCVKAKSPQSQIPLLSSLASKEI